MLILLRKGSELVIMHRRDYQPFLDQNPEWATVDPQYHGYILRLDIDNDCQPVERTDYSRVG
jgi:hypothetical protein